MPSPKSHLYVNASFSGSVALAVKLTTPPMSAASRSADAVVMTGAPFTGGGGGGGLETGWLRRHAAIAAITTTTTMTTAAIFAQGFFAPSAGVPEPSAMSLGSAMTFPPLRGKDSKAGLGWRRYK